MPGIEGAASGEAHDIVQETQRAGEGAVLIVDLGIDMAAVGGRDQGSGGLVILLRPGTDFKLGRKRRQSRWRSLRMLADIEIHEHAGMAAEALLQKGTRDFSGVVRQQLRLHAMDARRLLQGFDDVSEQAFFDLVTVETTGSVADRIADRVADEEVADNALILLVDKEGVAED